MSVTSVLRPVPAPDGDSPPLPAPPVEEAGPPTSLDDTVRRICADHPEADPAHVADLLDTAYARTEGAKVQIYREVLAEREVRRRLRVEAREHEEAGDGHDGRKRT